MKLTRFFHRYMSQTEQKCHGSKHEISRRRVDRIATPSLLNSDGGKRYSRPMDHFQLSRQTKFHHEYRLGSQRSDNKPGISVYYYERWHGPRRGHPGKMSDIRAIGNMRIFFRAIARSLLCQTACRSTNANHLVLRWEPQPTAGSMTAAVNAWAKSV